MQALSHRLHPARLELVGIAEAAAALCREISSLGALESAFIAENVPDGLPKRAAVCLYRVLQEALQNAFKYSGEDKTRCHSGRCRSIELTVRDFGAGFDVSTTKGRGLGLTSMRERVRAVRGRLASCPSRNAARTIHAKVPLV